LDREGRRVTLIESLRTGALVMMGWTTGVIVTAATVLVTAP
jgi:hypothetical protein